MKNFKGLAHIGVFTPDLERSKNFYIHDLGFELEYETTLQKSENLKLEMAFVRLDNLVIELLEPSDSTMIKPESGGAVNHIAIEVEDLPGIVKELKGKGIVFETEELSYMEKLFRGVRNIFLRGPSGERLELFEFLG